MYFLFDHLTAVLIGGALLMLLLFMQARERGDAIEAVEFSAARATTGAFLQFFEQDLTNVGAGVPAGEPRVHVLEAGTPTQAFEFSGAVAPMDGAPVERVRYETRLAGTVEVTEGGAVREVPAYEVVRLVGSEVTGRSAGTITQFELTLLDAAGAPVGVDIDAARAIDVRVAAVSPTGRASAFSITRWQRRIRINRLPGA